LSDEIKNLADSLLDNPALIEVARRNATADNIAQKVYAVDRDRKRQLLAHLIQTHQWFQVLVFTRTKHGANKLAEQLVKGGIPALAIHGNKSQAARTRALSEFKKGDLQVLVATDIAARGIDISELPHVVNYELPNVPEDYVHRIGRTGRAGAEGEALSLVCVDELDFLKGIERLIKRQLPREVVPGFEPDPNERPQPIQLRSQEGQRGRGQPRGQAGKPVQPGQAKPSGTPSGIQGQARPRAGGAPGSARPASPHRSGGRNR
jgi:ATP-dependent RNA helicase RhlE